jgi:type II secretory pathway pseudopilin PulG
MRKKGFTLIELLMASFVTIFAFSGAIYTYIMFQRFWRGGNVQLELQRNARITVDKITRQIRPALEESVLNNGNTLRLRLDPNGTATTSDDVWCQYDFSNNQITFNPDISSSNPTVILDHVYQSGTADIFSVNGKNVNVVFEVRDPTNLFGHKGTYMASSATLRNG